MYQQNGTVRSLLDNQREHDEALLQRPTDPKGIRSMTTQELDSSFEDPLGDDPAVPPVSYPADGGQPMRPARALVGWMAPGAAELMLASNTMGVPLNEEQRSRLDQMREAVAGRPAGLDQTGLVSTPPPALDSYLARLQATAAGEQMIREGWEVQLIDLDRVIAFQPHVFTDAAAPRVAALDVDDLSAVAQLTLPIEQSTAVKAQFDQLRQVHMVMSANPNLRVAVNFTTEVNGMLGFGFAVAIPPPFMQVACFEGRFILRDGYHRAFGLLSRGVTHVPVFVRNFDSLEQFVPAGMLPHGAWLGQRPPLLRDYRDDSVAENINLPATQKMIVIQAIELSPHSCKRECLSI